MALGAGEEGWGDGRRKEDSSGDCERGRRELLQVWKSRRFPARLLSKFNFNAFIIKYAQIKPHP